MMNLTAYQKLPLAFYQRSDVVQIAEELLGKYLFAKIDGILTVGKIVETEAYNGSKDKACHAFKRRTKRTETMYGAGGQAYVYLCYGIHHLFNVVTNKEGLADAVLIRALEPVDGVVHMQHRRGTDVTHQRLMAGPGSLCKAMGIHTGFNGVSLCSDLIWIAEFKSAKDLIEIEQDVRIGVDYAGEDALLPWRFLVKGSKFVSVKKKSPPKRLGEDKKSGFIHLLDI